MVGDEVYIQRGENWSLDFELTNEKGHPFMLLNKWQNPYLVITVSAALYEQKGDYRESYWLDLNSHWEELSNKRVELRDTKKFTVTEPLYVENFDFEYIHKTYDYIVLQKDNDFDIRNYLFYTDPYLDGNYVYKYVNNYTNEDWDNPGEIKWSEYAFRIIKQFDTKSWMEQGYLYDAKILTGESLIELIKNTLTVEGKSYVDGDWSDDETGSYISQIEDETLRAEAQELFDEGIPIRNNYDTKALIIEPTKLYVSVNLQGGVG
jgi:hypothetical protein